tara:strand:- start:2142 stop:2564 length:423 start_codon:yes stop_codon:yes gene_type:complete
MLKLYCRHCGSPNIYTLNKPVFCQGCGKNFAEGYAVSEKKSSESEISGSIEGASDVQEEEAFDVKISELDVEIDVRGPDTHTFEALSQAERTVYDNIRPEKTSKKKGKRRKKANKDAQISLNEGFKNEAGFRPAKENPPK